MLGRLAAALGAAAGNIVGLLATDRIYGLETSFQQGSVRAYVCWLGCVMFTAYSHAIYAFSIHFGPLFLPWVAVLGLPVDRLDADRRRHAVLSPLAEAGCSYSARRHDIVRIRR